MLNRTVLLLVFTLLALMPLRSAPPRISIGEKAPEVDLKTTNDKTLKLSSLQGNLVLVSFWSTWCVACNVIKNPEYMRLYNKFKGYSFDKAKKFTIYSVAFDSDKAKWAGRIKENNLDWDHVIDLDSYYSNYWMLFDIKSIPASFLLDEKGTIIGINLTYEQIERELNKRNPKAPQSVPTPIPPKDEPVVVDVKPPVKPPVETTPTPTPTSGGTNNTSATTQTTVFKIQIGATPSPDLSKYSNLKDLGTLEAQKATATLQRILLGTFSETKANTILAEVRKRGYKDAFVRKDIVTGPATDATATTTPPPATETTTKPPTGTVTSSILHKYLRVQLGVFRNYDPKNFAALSDIGTIETEKANGGLTRVLLGKFEKQADADQALLQVKSKGFNGILVKREETETVVVFANTQYGDAYQPMNEEPVSEMAFMRSFDFSPLKKTMLNHTAPEIMLPKPDNSVQSLTAQRGKVILLYLWATWSGPARENHEDLNKIYQQYKSKNFDIYSVAFDKNTERWKEAIAADKLSWSNQLIDIKGTDSDLLNKYQVEYLPALFIIDEKGNIIAENLTYEQLDSELKRLLGN